MRVAWYSSLALAVLVAVAAAWWLLRPAPAANLWAYTPADSAVERQWEARYRALPDAARLRATLAELSAEPHNAGSARNLHNAQWIEDQFTAAGWQAHQESFRVLYPTPATRVVELVKPTRIPLGLAEPALAEDPTSGQTGQLPTFNMYSADGDVTAPLVYANFGGPDDYAQLDKLGISVKGKIVLVRYGSLWRGMKPRLAAEHGAVGCLIYSDPHEDGYFQGDAWPNGPMRPQFGVQRGSVMRMELYPGDPETPGWGSTPDAPRLALNQVTNLQKIPVQPLSWGDAEPLLRALDGPVAPEAWRGALPLTYHLGGARAVVHLKLKFNWDLTTIQDVIAMLPGSEHPEQWIVRGNHYDAWVNGAEDPLSGQSALLEEARGLGELAKEGWRPRRTLVYAAWDAEEPALIGSTEWAETHAGELAQHAVVYLNSDTNLAGTLQINGSHSLERFFDGVAGDISDPRSGATVRQAELTARVANAATPRARGALEDGGDLRLGALGSGSDYTPFLDHLGIASADLGFGSATPNGFSSGVYHSIYDDYAWYSRYGDPGFAYERALAQTVGTAVMRLADAPVLPFQFEDLAANVAGWAGQLTLLAPAPGSFDFAPLNGAIARLGAAARAYDQALDRAASSGELARMSPGARERVNQIVGGTERSLLNPAGLPLRPWYQHLLYAPGYYTGYGVKTLPGVREALEQHDLATAASQQSALVAALAAYTAKIQAATAALPK